MMLTRPDKLLRWDVLERHLEEASFLWTQWENGLGSASYCLKEVAEGDEHRMLAHLDALAAGGEQVAVRLLAPALKGDDEECVRVACFSLLSNGDGEDFEAVLQALAEGSEARRQGSRRALELSPHEGLSGRILPLLTRRNEALVPLLLNVLDFRQVHPGSALTELLLHDDPHVKTAALRAARLWPADVPPSCVHHALNSPIPGVREAAIEAGLLCGMRGAWDACRRLVEMKGPSGELARVALAMGGQDADIERLLRLLSESALQRDVLWALGFSGRTSVAQSCLEWMHEPHRSAVAAEAFCAITGLVLQGDLVQERDPESTDELPPLEEDLDTDLTPGPDAELPLPNAAAVSAWWNKARKDFSPDTRYLLGRPWTPARLLEALEGGPMRRRPVLAREVAIRSRRGVRIETRDLSYRQYRQMQEARRSVENAWALRPFAEWMRG
ncbi:TIGR02270 family protein [Corallococcus terminator]